MNKLGGAFLHAGIWLGLGLLFYIFFLRQEAPPAQVVGADHIELARARDGHFHIDGTIQGEPVRFLIDTGASTVSISQQLAARIGPLTTAGNPWQAPARELAALVAIRRGKRLAGSKGWHRMMGYVLALPLLMFSVSGIIHLVRDFSRCNSRLWADKLGQITLATTTLLWGIFGNLRIIVFAWAAAALGYGTTQASNLAGVVIVGSVFGAVTASMVMKLDRATSVLPLGVVVGFLIIGLNLLTNVYMAAPFLVVLGALCGFLIVPMNALLQHRGHNLMGAGRSIAVQNFNEQACILVLGASYAGMTMFGLSAFGAITVFGLAVAGIMEIIRRWHKRNTVQHHEEVERLLVIARSDTH